jgi:prefoldin subunit 1
MESDVKLYKGVGKMFAKYPLHPGLSDSYYIHRFLMVPRTTMEQELKAQEKELTDDINNLNKKVCSRGTSYYRAHEYAVKISRKAV